MSRAIKIRAAGGDDAVLLATLCGFVHDVHVRERPDVFKQTDAGALAEWFRTILAAGKAIVWIAEIGGMPAGYALVVEQRRSFNQAAHRTFERVGFAARNLRFERRLRGA